MRPLSTPQLLEGARTATDVLRALFVWMGAPEDLSRAPKPMPSLPRPLRRSVLERLESFPPEELLTDMRRHGDWWKRVGEKLHPFEYLRRYPNTATAFAVIRRTRPDEKLAMTARGPVTVTWERVHARTRRTLIEDALVNGELEIALRLAAQRPDELTRHFDHLLRRAIEERPVGDGPAPPSARGGVGDGSLPAPARDVVGDGSARASAGAGGDEGSAPASARGGGNDGSSPRPARRSEDGPTRNLRPLAPAVVDALRVAAPHVPAALVLTLIAAIRGRAAPAERRVFPPLGSATRAYVTADTRPRLPRELVDEVVALLEASLLERAEVATQPRVAVSVLTSPPDRM